MYNNERKSFGQNLLRVVTVLGAARGEEAAVRSGPGHRAHTTRQQVLFLLGASSFSSHHPPAAPHTRQGVVISKRPMVATHQRERGSVVSGGGEPGWGDKGSLLP